MNKRIPTKVLIVATTTLQLKIGKKRPIASCTKLHDVREPLAMELGLESVVL